MLAVGLTGGIGSGKSAVADRLVARGAHLVDADQVARDVVEPGEPAYGALVERFGTTILEADGALDRATLARVAFADPEALRALNDITHPAIGAEILARRRVLAEEDGVVVVAIPLLRAAHRQTAELDVVVVVDCPVPVALARLVAARGMDRHDAERRIAAQVTREERRRDADYVLDNGGSLEALDDEVERLWDWLGTQRAAAGERPGR